MDLLARIRAATDPPLPLTLPPAPIGPGSGMPTSADIACAPERWGIDPTHYETQGDLASAIDRELAVALATFRSPGWRVAYALEPGWGLDRFDVQHTAAACWRCGAVGFTYTITQAEVRAHCAAGCSAEALAALLAELVARSERLAQTTAHSEAASALAQSCSLAALVTTAPDQRWLIPGYLAADALTLLGGTSGDGKTWEALHLAVAVASGVSWLGRRTARARVLVCLLEGSVTDHARRIAQLAAGLGTSVQALEGWLDVYRAPLRADDPVSMQRLADLVSTLAHELVVVDNLTEARGNTDENSAANMGAALRPLAELAHAGSGRAVFVLHHLNARGELRGSSAVRQHADVVYQITRAGPTNNAPVTLERHKDRFGTSLPHPVKYRLTDRVADRAVVPTLLGDAPQPAPALIRPKHTALLDLLPATPEALYAGLRDRIGSRTTIQRIRTELHEAGQIELADGVWRRREQTPES